jgi:ubiquinone/menaquinone biosynthesis C-methylase UbiE
MPTISQNYDVWDKVHSWSKDGDEWSDQASFCGQPYDAWKRSLVDAFMFPYISPSSSVLEIGPGHGRWTKMYIDKVARVSLVDLSPACIEHCKRRFQAFDHVSYFVNDGRSLSAIPDRSIDFIWSYDVFVHIELAEFRLYLSEFRRILREGGVAAIHHPSSRHSPALLVKALLVNGTGPLRSVMADYLFGRYGRMGRSFVSSRMIRRAAARVGLRAVIQTDTWGANGEYNCKKWGDGISVLKRV